MANNRLTQHPILSIPPSPETLTFYWQGQPLTALPGETISAALIAHGIHIFGHHPKDHSPLGIFCANGQCSQCLVLANGRPVKSCMELVQSGMDVNPVDGLPDLPPVDAPSTFTSPPQSKKVSVLIIGGGPAGLSAAMELGSLGVDVLLVDDKQKLGGKLVLQTHRFFGSTRAVYAGRRGIDIAQRLEKKLRAHPSVEIWTQSTAVGVFSDQKVGVLKENNQYVLIEPQVLLVASGAREKFLAFQNNTLPGVYGAGAFQTLVNRDLVKPAQRLFIVGGGNVGLIAGYHALQAGIEVVGLVEAASQCGGYKVHLDKLHRFGVPIYTSHTILSANGRDHVESITIAAVDAQFHPLAGTEKTFACDSVLIAVGLDPVNEFYHKAVEYGLKAFAAGDAEEIAEASAAIFSGKIRGLEIARWLNKTSQPVPEEWSEMSQILKSRPGKVVPEAQINSIKGVFPVIHCTQEIPCNPCSAVCPHKLIRIPESNIRAIPEYIGDEQSCEACERCVAGCPGLAITLVDGRQNAELPFVSIPFEFNPQGYQPGDWISVLDTNGHPLGSFQIQDIHPIPSSDRTMILRVQSPAAIATQIAGFQAQTPSQPLADTIQPPLEDNTIICRCERVTAGEIRALIRSGCRDMNQIKAVTRAGMGACGGKTCPSLIMRLFKEEGIPAAEVIPLVQRPLFIEAPLGLFDGDPNRLTE